MIAAQFYDASGAPLPVRGGRYTGPTQIASLNGEVVHDVDGDESCIVQVIGAAPAMTLSFYGSIDDAANAFPIQAVPIFGLGGTLPNFARPILLEALAAAVTSRFYAIRCSQLSKVIVRATAFTSGSAMVSVRSDGLRSLHPAVNDRPASTEFGTVVGAVGAGATLSLPAVGGQRHYIDRIDIVRSATVASLSPSATPITITTTNLGTAAFTMGQDAGGIGVDKVISIDFGGTGLAAAAHTFATTVVCPAYVGVVWRISAAYRLGY